jgi:hypothetical protein
MEAANIRPLKETGVGWPLVASAIGGAAGKEKQCDQSKEDRRLHAQQSIRSAE